MILALNIINFPD